MESKEYMELKREIGELSDCVKIQGETIQKIHQAIVGDKQYGQEGLVELVRKHDKWIVSQKFMWAKIYGGIAVGTSLGTLILRYWDKLI